MTKHGHFFVIEISSASVIASGKVSNDPLFIGARNSKTDGVLVITRSGQLLGLSVDESKLVQFINTACTHIPGNTQIGMKLAIL